MSIKELVIGGAITLVIGGTSYTVNQTDVIDNFANDTGVSQKEATEYVQQVKEEDLIPYDEVGESYVDSGSEINSEIAKIDCANYEYEWQSTSLTCEAGKSQLGKVARDDIALGNAYIKLSSDSADEFDISQTIVLIDTVNSNYDLPIMAKMYSASDISESKKANSYNKATLKAALNSDN